MSQKEHENHRRRGVLFSIALLALLLAPIANFSHATSPAPEISITIPSSHHIGNYTYIHGLVDVDVNITGNFTYATFYLDNELISQFNQSNNTINGTNYTYTTYHYFWNTTYTGEGPHIVEVVAYYPSGEVSLSKTYYVDNHKPVGTIKVSNSGILRGKEELYVSVEDPLYSISSGVWIVNLWIDNKIVYNYTLSNLTSQYSFTYLWNTEKYEDGHHTATIQVWDNAGNEANYSYTYLVDNHAPSIAIISNLYLKGTATINVSVSDKVSGISKVEFYIDNQLTYTAHNYPYLFVWNTQNYSDGKHLITAKVYDKAGNNASASVYVIVDNTPPVITLLSPQQNTMGNNTLNNTLNGTIQVKIKGEDATTGMSYMKLYIDNTFVASGINQINYTWNTTKFHNGYYKLTIVASDKVGNIAVKSYGFKIYNKPKPPTLTIISPKNNTLLGTNQLRVEWESYGPIQYYEVKVDNTNYIKTQNTTYIVTLADGEHIVYVKAVFKGLTITKSIVVKIDTSPPRILGLLGKYTFTKPNYVNFTIKDASPIQVFIYVQQGNNWVLYNQGNSSKWSIYIDKKGHFTFKVVAVDAVQNEESETFQVSYEQGTHRVVHRGSPFLHLVLYPVLLLLIALIVAVVAMKKLKKSKKKKEGSGEALSTKERAILDEIMKYVSENEGAKRGDVIKIVSNRMGITEEEVGVMLDFARENYLVNEKVDADGVPRVYPLEKPQGTEQAENAPSEEKKKRKWLRR